MATLFLFTIVALILLELVFAVRRRSTVELRRPKNDVALHFFSAAAVAAGVML